MPQWSNPLAKARTDLWQKLSDNAKRQFSWPQPKAEKANDEAFTSPVTSAKASSTEASSAEASREDTPNNSQTQQKPPKTFCLLCLSVSTVDHLALRGEPQDRYLYEKNRRSKLADKVCQSLNCQSLICRVLSRQSLQNRS